MIGYWHRNDHTVVCPSVHLWRCALWHSGSVQGVESCTVVFLERHFRFTSSVLQSLLL